MHVTSISTKGQVVIPKKIREVMGIKSGTRFKVDLEGNRVILIPVGEYVADELYGKFKDTDLLGELSKEHAGELKKEIGRGL
ncbi:MAG: AbrB/MazE/SpoVT family DNA-binding domain-containing protein [Peptococcaceae bacterium]|nr:MAG: AbrB/MazE/SpoVT family DNA-binding domain-containing protein [Peptococcaceae bacterium]